MAGFCNFQDKTEFHHLQFSPPFLDAYQMWHDYRKDQKEYLSFIADEDEDLSKTEDLNSDTFHLIFCEIRKKYS